MVRSDWGIVATFGGCLALAGLTLWDSPTPHSPSEAETVHIQPKEAAPSQVAQTDAATPKQDLIPDPGCKRGEDNRQSDLCAQWKAADSAFDAAWWSMATFYAGLFGLFLGAVTMGAAIAAAIFAKRAADETRHGNDIVRRQTQPQLIGEIIYFQATPSGLSLKISISNTGMTAASQLRATFSGNIAIFTEEVLSATMSDSSEVGMCPPGGGDNTILLHHKWREGDAVDFEALRDAVVNNTPTRVTVIAATRYQDVFGKYHGVVMSVIGAPKGWLRTDCLGFDGDLRHSFTTEIGDEEDDIDDEG